MSFDNDPFDDTQPAPLPPPEPEFTHTAPQPTAAQPPTFMRSPAVWIGGAIVLIAAMICCVIAVFFLGRNIGSGGQPASTLTPTPAGPSVVAIPNVVSGGTLVTLQGANFRPNDRVVFYLRNPSRPSEPIVQIGATVVSVNGTFAWSFKYPTDEYWTSLTAASVIAQSTATGAYFTVSLIVAVPTRGVLTLSPTPGGGLTPVPSYAPPASPTYAPPPVQPTPVQPTPVPTSDPNQWRGEYYNNPNLQGAPVLVRNDPSINFDWGTGSPAPNVPVDYFSVRWTRTLNFNGGMYRFLARSDDGVRVWLDSQLVIDEWHTATPNTYLKDLNVTAGQHVVRVEYYEGVGVALINFSVDPVTVYPDWKGEYYNNTFVSGSPLFIRNDVAVSFDWGTGSPAPNVPAGNFSTRWTRTANLDPGTYRFTFRVNGGVDFLIDGNLIISEWRQNINGTFTKDFSLGAGTHTLEIRYFSQATPAYIWFTYQPLIGTSSDWNGSYFANERWSGIPTMARFDANINFDWGTGAPSALLPADNFSVRWTRVLALEDGEYQIDVTVDDGVRIYVDGSLVIDKVMQTSSVSYVVQIRLGKGNHEFRVEYVEYTGNALIMFRLTPLNVFVTPTPAPPSPTPLPTLPPTVTPTAPPTVTPTMAPTSTSTPVPTTTPTQSALPVINSFIAAPPQVQVGLECVTLTWMTSNAQSPISLEVNGQLLQSNLPASGQANHCPTEPGTKVYSLTITSSPNYNPVSATQIVEAITPQPQPR